MKISLFSSTAMPVRIRAFDNSFPPALPGQYDRGFVASIIASAKAAGASPDAGSTKQDLSKRAKDSAAMLPYWQLTEDIVTGYSAIKAGAEKYLPKFADEEQNDYTVRLNNGKFTNVYRDIVESLASKPFEEEVSLVEVKDKATPDEITKFIEDVDGAGNNLSSFAGITFFNGINSAIDWIFVDYPVINRNVIKTMADAKAANIKPFWSHVLGCNVLEARSAVINGNEELIYIRIIEPGTPNHIRIFEKVADKQVIWGLFREDIGADGKDKTFILVDSGNVTIGVIPLVPFYTGRRDGRSFKFYPVMQDAADLQIELYQMESGLKFAKVMTAYPMLAANGIKPQMEADGTTPKKIKVGPNRVLYSIPDGAGNVGNWGYVSPDAACLKFLADDVKDTTQQLRELGRLPLTAQSGNLTVITTAFAAGKAKSAVAAWGLRLKDAIENALVMTGLWFDITKETYDPQVNVYDEYDDYADSAVDVTALKDARAARDISRKAYLHELKRRDILCAEFSEEDDAEELLNETPSDDENVIDDGTGKPDPTKPKPKPKTGQPPATK